jgi:hypothetical protein
MNKDLDSKFFGIIGGAVFAIATLGGFAWLWMNSKPAAISTTGTSIYAPVDVSGLKTQISGLFSGTESNLSEMPIAAPGADKVGRDNPFVAY